MRKIKIFLGSSITEFKIERIELENFIYKTSRDIFEKNYNIQIEPLLCENMDNYVREDGTQGAINEELILGSDMCFFVFFTKAGEFTQQEFKVAFEKFKKDGKPKIYIYFKNLKDSEKAEDSIREFMDKIDNELSHYHGTFDHIDTIKLRILLNLKLQEMDFVSVEFENGKCIMDGKDALDLSNVSEFANNGLLKQFQQELAEIEEHYVQMKPIYAKGGASDLFCKKYTEVASKRQNLIDTIEELQKNIFNMSLRICKDEVHGEITARQKEAYRLFELGDYEGCMSVLDENEIDNDFFAFEKQEEEKLKRKAIIYIREHKTAIDILMTMTNYKNRFIEIEERYEKIVKVAEKYLVELDVIFNYAEYLYDQNQFNKATEVARKLEVIYTNNALVIKDFDKAKLFNLLGSIYLNIFNKYTETEIYYMKAIKIKENLAKDNPKRFSRNLAVSYNNVGVFYDRRGNLDKAKAFYHKAIKIYEKLADKYPEIISGDLAEIYNNTGSFYDKQDDVEKADDFYHKTLRIIERLYKDNPDKYGEISAIIYKNVSAFYSSQGDAEKAKSFLYKALGIIERLVKDNPEKFYRILASIYNSVGNFYIEQGEVEKAECYLYNALEIIKILVKGNDEIYIGDLASSYNNVGVFHYYQGDIEKAKSFYSKAIEIRERLFQENPENFSQDLADSYYNAGNLYNNQLDIAKAKSFYHKAIRIRERLAKDNSISFSVDLANSYYKAGTFYKNQGNIEKAKVFYHKTIDMYERLAKDSPEKFSIDLANCYNNIGMFYGNQGDVEKVKNFYYKAIPIYEKLANENPSRYKPDLAVSYFNFAQFTNDIEAFIIAFTIARQYPENLCCKQIIDFFES